MGFSALKQSLQVLGAENGFVSGSEVNMKIQPAIVSLLERKAGFEADNILDDMLKSLTLLDAPFLFEAWQLGGKKPHDGILAAQDGLAFVVLESAAHEPGKRCGLCRWILDTWL